MALISGEHLAVEDTAMFSGTGSLSSSTSNPAFLSSKKLSRVIFRPALTLSGSNCLSYEFSSRSRSDALLLSLLPQMGGFK